VRQHALRGRLGDEEAAIGRDQQRGACLLAVDVGDGPGRAGRGIEQANVELGELLVDVRKQPVTLAGSAASQGCVVALVSAASCVSLAGSREASATR
jgi:hypothetical protein